MPSPSTAEDIAQLLRLSDQLRNAADDIVLYHRVLEFSRSSLNNGYKSDSPEPVLIPADSPLSLREALQTIAETTTKLQLLITSPGSFLSQQAVQTQHLYCLRWLCHFDIVSKVPIGGAVAYDSIAQEAKVPVSQLKSVARMAMTAGFFAEPEPGKLSHSRLSAAFAKDPSLKDWALFLAEASADSASKFVEATEKWGETQSKTQTAYNIAKNTDVPYFEYLGANKRLSSQFAGYMKNITKSNATSMNHVVDGFDWASVRDGSVIDVGGSSGHASIAVAKVFPSLKFTIQDLASTIESSATDLSTLPPEIASRISFTPHDFFTPQPIKNANVYFMRTIIHDWPFAEATQILGHIAAAMAPGGKSRLLIMDIVLPRPGTASVADESLARLRDLTMIQTFNAKEREMSDWEDLVTAVGQGLVIKSVNKPVGSSLSILEIIKEDPIHEEVIIPSIEGTHGAVLDGQNGYSNGHT